jgi:valyl-tRNA synthetase
MTWLGEQGLLEKEEGIKQNIATAERTGGVIEPLPKLQWFVNVNKPIATRGGKTLKELMHDPVASGEIKIMPEHEERKYFNWIKNLRDWCISRQIWYGHRIPVWYKEKEVYCGTEAPSGEGWTQDEDTLDTWFSSGLWTFSTLGWPNETNDLKMYHPTSVLETGYDILFFWVARMILMTEYALGTIPFHTVYLHGLVRDAKGQKISKSLGNNIDPLDMIRDYGADATRMSLIIGTGPGSDSKFSLEKIGAHKKFANKVWNISRFILSQEGNGENGSELIPELKSEFDKLVKEVTKEMDDYKFYIVAEKIYHYVWHRLADEIIEESKGKPEYAATLKYILEGSLKLLHPFMPFVTEEIWGIMHPSEQREGKLLMIEPWPIN